MKPTRPTPTGRLLPLRNAEAAIGASFQILNLPAPPDDREEGVPPASPPTSWSVRGPIHSTGPKRPNAYLGCAARGKNLRRENSQNRAAGTMGNQQAGPECKRVSPAVAISDSRDPPKRRSPPEIHPLPIGVGSRRALLLSQRRVNRCGEFSLESTVDVAQGSTLRNRMPSRR
jgi:hypothetical protein